MSFYALPIYYLRSFISYTLSDKILFADGTGRSLIKGKIVSLSLDNFKATYFPS